MQINVCKTPMDYPAELGELRDANGLLGDMEALRARMREDGYLLLRGFHPRRKVMEARERILSEMKKRGVGAGQHRVMKDIAAASEVMAVLESPRLFDFFEGYFGEPSLTFSEKWLRAVENGKYTGLHYDRVYMGRGSSNLHTVWTPFGDTPMELGTLAICVGSHTEKFRKLIETYGQSDVDRDRIAGGGWFSHDPREVSEKFGGEWKTTNFQAGDIMIITMLTMHCSTQNVTDRIRLSCDIRFQPASEPADERWYGPQATGHVDFGKEPLKSLQEAKTEWGL